ncbi:OmpA family protein [Novosphingobium soli]|uniref:OmpA family protein n=1 Tax=Novosphingobium soli TaxID=574956 RepID=A0ABV6D217_9SPHN
MVKASVSILLSASLFAGAQVASAQSAAVSEDEIKCFVSGCDEPAAQDAGASEEEDDCMVSGICPVGETRGFHLSTGTPAKPGASRAAASKPAGARPSAPRYSSAASAKPAGSRASGASRLAMPGTRKSLDMRLSFELGSATLTPDARQQADIFARQLKDAAGSRQFVIEGHTDNIGSPAYNRELSRERAQAVVNYLVGAGVPSAKLRAVGYGFDHPRDGTVASDPSNRRVEIVRY